MNTICPVSNKTINEYSARFTASLTFIFLLIFFLTNSLVTLILLAGDFFIRAIDKGKYSPLAFFSWQILKIVPLEHKSINAGPKIFAARIGFLLCIISLLLWSLSFSMTAIFVLGILALFSFLEATIGFCMACVIYPYVYRFFYKNEFNE